MSAAAYRARFVADSVSTASPGRLLTMLYDRLVLDLVRAEDAERTGDRDSARANLMHAQDIVFELLTSLDVTSWSGGPGLASLYGFVINELMAANVSPDPERVATCRGLVEPLRDAWHTASHAAAEAAAPTQPLLSAAR